MKVSRRSFVHAGCVAITLAPHFLDRALAGINNPGTAGGSAGASAGHSVLNANFSIDQYLNLAKGFTFALSGTMTPANLNADQYPSGVIPNNYGGNTGSSGIDTTYFGHYLIALTGVSAFAMASGQPCIIYAGGTFAGQIGSTGAVQNTLTVGTTANPSVEFAVGALITAVGTNGGLVQFSVTSGFWGNFASSQNVKLNNLSGLPAGPNADGSWTATKIDNQTFTLVGSSAYAGLVSINISGTVGVNTEAIVALAQFTFNFLPTYNASPVTHNLSNFILCYPSNLSAVNSGQQLSSTCIAAIRAINPRYVRFMDVTATQSLYSNYAGKAPSTSLYWGVTRWDPTYYAGTTAGSADAYTCSNPSASPASGPPVDGETIQVTFNRTNTTTVPTLAISRTSFGSAVPIYASNMSTLRLKLTGSTTNGDVLTFTFSNPNFSGGTHVVNYTVNTGSNGPAGVPDSSIDHLGANLNATFGNDGALTGIGIFSGNGGFGLLAAQCATPTTATFSASGSATELCSPGTFDAAGTLASGASGTFIYSAVLGAWVFLNSGVGCGVPLEYIYEMCTRANVGAWVCLNIIYTHASTTLLGAAMATNLPNLPVACELSNEVWNFSEAPVGQAIALGTCIGFGSSGGGYMDFYGLRTAQLLPAFASGWTGTGRAINRTAKGSDLELITADTVLEGSGGYTGQMVQLRWNGGCLSPTPVIAIGSITGTTLTFGTSVGSVPRGGMQVTGSGVTAGTVITKVLSATQCTVNNSQSVASTTITLTNPLYSLLSGPGGTASSTAYNAFPTRPIDLMDGTSYATYIEGTQAGNNPGSWSGTQSFYNTLFQASADYASGTPSLMAGAIAAWSNDIRSGTKNGVSSSSNMASFLGPTNAANGQNFLPGWETKVAVYDSARPGGKANLTVRCYEGMVPQQSMTSGDSGVNPATSPASMNSQFTSNGWTLSPTFGASNLIVATNLVTLSLAYRNDPQLAADQLYFWNQQKAIHANRPFSPGQFGVENGNTNTWALYPGLLTSTSWQNLAGQAQYNSQNIN